MFCLNREKKKITLTTGFRHSRAQAMYACVYVFDVYGGEKREIYTFSFSRVLDSRAYNISTFKCAKQCETRVMTVDRILSSCEQQLFVSD